MITTRNLTSFNDWRKIYRDWDNFITYLYGG